MEKTYSQKYYALHKDYFRKRYLDNKERILVINRLYKQTEAGKCAQAKSDTKNHIKFPEKRRARRIIEWEIKKGTLVKQPCKKCGAVGRIHAHHEDYCKPLEVIWLCRKHHIERHKEMQLHVEVMTIGVL